MTNLIDVCAFSSVMLAATCWDERRRYERLVPHRTMTYRDYYLKYNDDEEGYRLNDTWVLRGEKGFAYAKKEYDACYNKYLRSYKRHAKKRAMTDKRRDNGHRDRLLKRGEYMDY